MAIQEYESLDGHENPQISLLKEFAEGGEPVYHFFIDGQESLVTLNRDDTDQKNSEYTYHFKFCGWEFGEADIHSCQDVTSIEWLEVTEGLDGLGEYQAKRLMVESEEYLLAAIRMDFPETGSIEYDLPN